jgi:hypothetical protein
MATGASGASLVILFTAYAFNGVHRGGGQAHEQTYHFDSEAEADAFLAGIARDTLCVRPGLPVTPQVDAFLLGERERGTWRDATPIDQDPSPDQPSGIRIAVHTAEWMELLHDQEDWSDVFATGIWSDERGAWCVPYDR